MASESHNVYNDQGKEKVTAVNTTTGNKTLQSSQNSTTLICRELVGEEVACNKPYNILTFSRAADLLQTLISVDLFYSMLCNRSTTNRSKWSFGFTTSSYGWRCDFNQSIKQVYCTEPCHTHTINLTNKNKREKSHT